MAGVPHVDLHHAEGRGAGVVAAEDIARVLVAGGADDDIVGALRLEADVDLGVAVDDTSGGRGGGTHAAAEDVALDGAALDVDGGAAVVDVAGFAAAVDVAVDGEGLVAGIVTDVDLGLEGIGHIGEVEIGIGGVVGASAARAEDVAAEGHVVVRVAHGGVDVDGGQAGVGVLDVVFGAIEAVVAHKGHRTATVDVAVDGAAVDVDDGVAAHVTGTHGVAAVLVLVASAASTIDVADVGHTALHGRNHVVLAAERRFNSAVGGIHVVADGTAVDGDAGVLQDVAVLATAEDGAVDRAALDGDDGVEDVGAGGICAAGHTAAGAEDTAVVEALAVDDIGAGVADGGTITDGDDGHTGNGVDADSVIIG